MEAIEYNMVVESTPQLKGRTLVVGLGKTGLSVVRFLSGKAEMLAVTDNRDLPPGLDVLKLSYPDIARFVGEFDDKAFQSADRLIVSPGVSLKLPVIHSAMSRGIPAFGDIELFAQYVDKPVIAITGSNGKTTVTSLLGKMAEVAGINVGVGGNIGIPALDLLGQEYDLYILELSSFQLETLSSLKPVSSVVLNVSEDHMDRYESLDEYAQAKATIYKNAEHAVVNLDDVTVKAMPVNADVIGFSTLTPVGEKHYGLVKENNLTWLCRGERKLCLADDLLLAGEHNFANVLAALALGDAAGLPFDAMLEATKDFPGLAHRTQFVAEIDKVRYYNDSKATNVGACKAALMGLDKHDATKTVVILGGDCKEADFSELTQVTADTCRAVVLIGRDASEVEKYLPEDLPRKYADSLEQAVICSTEFALPGDRVLLSPACASFDMFSGFEDRGEQFMRLVQEIGS